MGAVGAATRFEGAQSSNRFLAWMLRLLGYLMIVFGVRTLLRPPLGVSLLALAMAATVLVVRRVRSGVREEEAAT